MVSSCATEIAQENNQEATERASGNFMNRIIPSPNAPTEPYIPYPTEIFAGNFAAIMKGMGSGDNIENVWRGHFLGQDVSVYAGADPNDVSQGVLDIQNILPYSLNWSYLRILSPVKTGSLKIQSVDGVRLTITTKGDDILYFDVASQSFIRSLNAVSPATKTPLQPKPTPTLVTIPTLNPALQTNPTSPYP